MAIESQILINNYGVSEEFAQKLLNFTQQDLEGAIKILEASEKDVYAIKIKFLSSKKLAYGAIIIFYNMQNHVAEYIYCVVSADNKLSKIHIEGTWNEFISEMSGYMINEGADFDAASRIETEILNPENLRYFSQFFADRHNPDLVNLKRFILNHLSKILLDTGIVIKLVTDTIDVFKYKNTLNQLKSGTKIVPKTGKNYTMLVNMHIEPVLAPIGGTDIDKMSIGEEILVKVDDDRDIVRYIGQLLKFEDDTGLNKALYGRVVKHDHNTDSQNHLVTLEFGPGVYGTFSVGQKVRVQSRIRPEASQVLNGPPVPPPPQEGDAPPLLDSPLDSLGDIPSLKSGAATPQKKRSNVFLIINIVLIVVVAIVIFFILFSN